MDSKKRSHCWRGFGWRDRRAIRGQMIDGSNTICPRCRFTLEVQPGTRLAAVLPGGVQGYDLVCRDCRQFYPVVRHTPRSRYRVAVHRLARAVVGRGV